MKLGKWAGLVSLVVAASCVQVLDGAYEYQALCTADADCDDTNPCTIDECLADNSCEHNAAIDGTLPVQIAGDCRRDECSSGEIVSMHDDADIADDGESCTTDTCADGNPAHTPMDDATACSIGESTGICFTGVCSVQCNATNPCNDSNPCTDDSCNVGTGVCSFAILDGILTPGVQDVAGDCTLQLCVNGADTAIDDDSDVPDDLNPCTENVCSAGVPSNPAAGEGMPCIVGQPEVCDGLGACVQCNVSDDCVLLPADDECQTRTCDNHVCGQTFAALGVAISMQTDGDCRQIVCDGAGGTTLQNFDVDLPDDNNPCTLDVCATGMPSNPPAPLNASCNGGLFCDGAGQCVGCNAPNQCAGTDDFCKKRTCVNNMCGFSFTPNGTDLPTGQTAADCKVLECNGAGNSVTRVDTTDKPIDGNQCTQDICSAQGNPSNPFEVANFPCSQSGGTVCNGAGACKKANSAVCSANSECLSGFCVDGVCCSSSCGGTCKSCSVSGSIGTCSNVLKGIDDAPGCTGTNSCDGAGTCRKDDGQSCSGASECLSGFCVDGVCCASNCTGTCKACNIAGTLGICSNVSAGQDDAGTCSGTNQSCDGAGACKLELGASCVTGTNCLSGFCADGYCCDAACNGTCEACAVFLTGQGFDGVCGPIVAGTDPDDECAGVDTCDGAGMCQ